MFNDVSQSRTYCTPCTGSKYVVVSGVCKLCSEVLENCLECSTGPFCTKCYPTYNLYNSNFNTKFTNCLNKDQTNLLFYKKASDGSGIVYNCISGCTNCDSPGTCRRCEEGLFLYNYDNDAEGTYDGCVPCTEKNQFIAMNTEPATCKSCRVDNCDNCVQGSEQLCSKCLEGWFLFSSTGTFQYNQCVRNAYVGSAYYCPQQVTDGSGVCKSCLKNCQSCMDGVTCNLCSAGFLLFDADYNGVYESCIPEATCVLPGFVKKLNSFGYSICSRCKDVLNNCLECLDATSCKKCETYYWLYSLTGNELNLRCTSCQDAGDKRQPVNSILGEGRCVKCPTGCETCDSDGYCLKCLPGLVLRSSTKTQNMDQCIVCNDLSQYIEFSPEKQGPVCYDCDRVNIFD